MDKQIFREKSIKRVSSPEQLGDYVRVSNPGVWMVLVAVIILLIGVCVWGIFGHLDTTLCTVAVCKDGKITCYIPDSDIGSVKAGMKVTVNDKEYEITAVSPSPVCITEDMDSYILYVGNLQVGQWVYEVSADAELDSGTYQAKIITDSTAPISFVLN